MSRCTPGIIQRAGDGVTEPRQEWQYCTCGTLLWEAEDGHIVEPATPWEEHVTLRDFEDVTGHRVLTWGDGICHRCGRTCEDGDTTRCEGAHHADQ